MENKFQQPLSFGKILDQTFRIIRSYFKPIFLITFYVMIPVLALQAIILALSGHAMLIAEDSIQNIWSATVYELEMYEEYSFANVIGQYLSYIPLIFATPLLVGGISHVVKRARAGEPAEAVEMLKMTMPRYWPLLGSTLLFGIIVFGITFGAILIGGVLTAITALVSPVFAVLLGILLFIGGAIGIGLLTVKWMLYLPATLFEKVAPGLGKSWRLTKRQAWKFFGIYIILTILSSIIIGMFQLPTMFLGSSIVSYLWTNFISLISSIILAVAWAVMYFDASLRQDAADIQDLVDTYHS
mgnify:CR=1 FL=1